MTRAHLVRILAWLAGVALCLGPWQWAHERYGTLILASPLETLSAMWQILGSDSGWLSILLTFARGLAGFLIAVAVATPVGLAAGRLPVLTSILHPPLLLLLGTPPIAWIVLAILWFGTGGLGPVVTVGVSLMPGIFLTALQGASTVDDRLLEMARVFRVPKMSVLRRIYVPHALSYLVPAYTSSLGSCWKMAVMAELLGSSDGIGARLADARTNLDTATVLGWILAIVVTVFFCDLLLTRSLRFLLTPWARNRGTGRMAEPAR